MAEYDFAQTIRIDLHPEQDEKNDTHVTIFQPNDDGKDALLGAQPQSNIYNGNDSAYQRLLQCIYDAVLITDSKGVVLECNQRAIDFLKYPQNEIMNTPVSQFVCGIDTDVLASIRKNLLDQRYTLIEGFCQRSDKSVFPSEIAVNRLDLSDPGRLCFFIRNISVRKRAQDALEDAIEKVEKHDRQRSQFVSNVSHELRTPLTSMTYAITNMLKGVVGSLSSEADEYLEMLLGDCSRMLATVNDILDLRKIESQTLKLVKTSVPYGRLVRRSVKSLRGQAAQKSINLGVETDDRLSFVSCDGQKIERVIINLIGNAIKFTPERGKISVVVGEDIEHPGFVSVIVDDNGLGIPDDAVSRVTERYFTVGSQPSGSGLGLAISKEIVVMHGGELEVESPVPGTTLGTRISFTLPVIDPPSVMIVDDDLDLLDKMETQIGEHGYHVLTASKGEEALALVAVSKPDIIVLDLALPDIAGKDVIMKLKGDPETARIPILLMTGAHLDRSMSDVLRNFGIPVILKPCDSITLLDGIANAFLGKLTFMSR